MALFVRRRWPRAVAALVVLAALGLVAFMVTRDSGRSRSETAADDVDVETAEPVPEPSPDTVTFDTVLALPDGGFDAYEGHEVVATSVPVLSVVGPSAAWVGPSAAERVLIVLVGSSEAFSFEAGARLSFTGTVHRAARGFGAALGLEGADVAAFDKQGGYVEVGAVSVE